MLNPDKKTIAVIGLGYVGLPLAVEFGKIRKVIGYDINSVRISELQSRIDKTLELDAEEILAAKYLRFTSDCSDLKEAEIFIITVPTPIDIHKQPDLGPLLSATQTVARVLKRNDLVIYESTVYPGATEEDCVPELERISGLKFNEDFFCGYSPERINPGDKSHKLTQIKKVTSGSTLRAADAVDTLYASIITAGTYKATSIKVAEAAKVIENTQRDLNIALVNELAMIFNKMGIDTHEVLEAASTKWNFQKFQPGLVGGHCIGVDPYYLTFKAEAIGCRPEVILAGRRTNDNMGAYIATHFVKKMIINSVEVAGARVLILGITFKENCPDIRNTRVIDLINELISYGISVDVSDSVCDKQEAAQMYGLELIDEPEKEKYDGIIVSVAHSAYRNKTAREIRKYGKQHHVFYDVKSVFNKDESDLRL
jgi:UDP-N-acetyl-D-galactosamine dehydrogenase